MHVYRRNTHSPIYHYKFEHRGVVVRKSTRTSNRKAAERIALAEYNKHVQRASGVALDEDVDRPAVTLSTLAERYLDWARADHPATADSVDARTVEWFVDYVGGRDTFIHTITASTIDWWRVRRAGDKTRRGTPVKRSTIDREFGVVRGMFRQAVLWDYLAVSPCDEITCYGGHSMPVRILTADELERAFADLPEPFNLFCEVTYRTLARLREVCALRAEHVTIDRLSNGQQVATLQKRVKGGEWKRVRIPLPLAQRLRAQVTSDDQVYIFPDYHDSPSVSALFTKHFRAAKLRCSHHAFRHSGITRMLEGGVNPRAIQEHAGWSSLQQLARYGRVLDLEFARAVEVTDDFLQNARAEKKAAQRNALSVVTGGVK